MAPIFVFSVLVALWLTHLVVERVRLDRDLARVPLRIAVTGTRGKTTVTRLLSAVLREDGRTVLAKTTGSEVAWLLPDGSAKEIRRLGRPSILEQKSLVRMGAKLGVDALVVEVMSVHAENHLVEARRLLRPHLVLATNFRVDHTEAQGTTPAEVASVLALDVPEGARALVPEEEWEPRFAQEVGEGGATAERVPVGAGTPPEGWAGFASNLDLVWATARSLGVAEEVIRTGVSKARGDVGTLAAWRYDAGGGRVSCTVVNAFAANDPHSTHGIHDRVLAGQGLAPEDCIGLLGLRADRGDRTLQWAEALEEGGLDRYRHVFVVGRHGRALVRRLRRRGGQGRITALPPSKPAELMKRILREGAGRALKTEPRRALKTEPRRAPRLVFGFGNMGGVGEALVRHWNEVGEPHGI